MEGSDAGSDTGTAGDSANQPQDSITTVYNGSEPCAGGCGTLLSPVAAIYSNDRHCHNCRKKKHHKHIKSRMSGR